MAHGHRRGAGSFTVDSHKRARSTKVLLGSLWKYIRIYVKPIILVVSLSILYSVLTIVNPIIIGQGIDSIATDASGSNLLHHPKFPALHKADSPPPHQILPLSLYPQTQPPS